MDNNLALDGLLIARDIAPKETGNLAFNAISMRYTPNGFKIYYSGQKAFYLEFLQEGTKYSTKHKGFIDITATAISAHLTASLNGHKNNLNATRDRVAKWGMERVGRQDRMVNSLRRTREQEENLLNYSLMATVTRS